MAEPRPTHGPFQVQVEYLFDRLRDSKLAQAYSLLVPVRERPVGGSVKEFDHEDGSNLRTGLFRSAAGGAHDREPDGVVNQRITIWKYPTNGSSKMMAIAERRWNDRGLSV
jgi:hypothetical protein